MRDAIRSLQVLRQTPTALPPERAALCDRLLRRLYGLLDEEPSRARALEEHGGPETLLHGDPWPKNALVIPAGRGLHARLIDWDRAGVGPVGYDLSTFLGRLAAPLRPWALDLYRQAAGRLGWRLPLAAELNRLFETAELARLANCVIWPALAAAEGQPAWAFDQLADLEQWLQRVEPVLPSR
jgi:Ser/Thr protein kinase RdoA (MazF antagonist)